MATDIGTEAQGEGAGAGGTIRGNPTFVQATHNMLFSLNKAEHLMDLRKSAQGHITHYQEAGDEKLREILKDWCAQNNRGLYHPLASGNPISWNRTMFTALRKSEAFVVQVHKKHPTAKFNPARDITARGLLHTPTGEKVLVINVHPVAGATNPNPEWTQTLSQWKNWALGNYMLDLVSFTAAQMSREFYDVILLGGDYNGDLLKQKTDEWYYPSRILPSLYKDAKKDVGLDHLQATHTADVKAGRDWVEQGNTDHPLCFQTWAFTNVSDYPGE